MKNTKSKNLEKRKERTVVVSVRAFGLTILSNAVARTVLDGLPHPHHWHRDVF